MSSVLTATLGNKGQITLPKNVRQLLGLEEPGALVGFVIDEEAKTVLLSKLKVSFEEDFSEEEYRKLLNLPKPKGGKSFPSMGALLKDLKAS